MAESFSLKGLGPQKQIYERLIKPVSTDICENVNFSQDTVISDAIV